jgi:hypothetical protein
MQPKSEEKMENTSPGYDTEIKIVLIEKRSMRTLYILERPYLEVPNLRA